MLSIDEQLRRGALVCPRSHQRLSRRGGSLETPDGAHSYPLRQGVPVLLRDPGRVAEDLAADRGAMVAEYEQARRPSFLQRLYRRAMTSIGDFRSTSSRLAFQSLFEGLPADALCLSIGGGPGRRISGSLSEFHPDRAPSPF